MSKNLKGGYKLISLDKVDVESMSVGVTIKGIHKAIESSYAKALLLTAIVIGGVEKNDVYIDKIVVDSGDFKFTALGYDFTITDEDEVTAVEHQGGGESGTQLYEHKLSVTMLIQGVSFEVSNVIVIDNIEDDIALDDYVDRFNNSIKTHMVDADEGYEYIGPLLYMYQGNVGYGVFGTSITITSLGTQVTSKL